MTMRVKRRSNAGSWAGTELPRDWSPETDTRLPVWEALHHLIRALNQDGESAAGVLLDVELGRGWVFTPGFGGGYYNAASGLDLGFDAEFRSSLELSRRFRNGSRLGFVFAHVSNGSLGDKNPGSETLGLNCDVPLDRLFRRRAVPAAAD